MKPMEKTEQAVYKKLYKQMAELQKNGEALTGSPEKGLKRMERFMKLCVCQAEEDIYEIRKSDKAMDDLDRVKTMEDIYGIVSVNLMEMLWESETPYDFMKLLDEEVGPLNIVSDNEKAKLAQCSNLMKGKARMVQNEANKKASPSKTSVRRRGVLSSIADFSVRE